MAERDTPPEALPLRTADGQLSSDTENGHTDSPDESLSPTSVIYFKEAYSSYSSANLSFGHAGGAPLSVGGPPPHFDFRIERIDSKRRSELSAVQLGVTGAGVVMPTGFQCSWFPCRTAADVSRHVTNSQTCRCTTVNIKHTSLVRSAHSKEQIGGRMQMCAVTLTSPVIC